MEMMDEQQRYKNGCLGREMEHQNGVVPAELAQEWEQATIELSEASQALYEAQRRYHAALMARLALSARLT